MRGPVGAAWLHLERIHAAWVKPFTINILDTDVNVLEVPPKSVARALREHARRHLDRKLIASLASEHAWDIPAVVRAYAKGIDWALVRSVLLRKQGGLTPLEAKAYLILVTGAFWPEERRWRSGGMVPTGTCLACCQDAGSTWHKGNDCGAVEQQLTWMRVSGRQVRRPRSEPELMPLATLGIPPLLVDSRPRDFAIREGRIDRATQGFIFGDASGVGRRSQPPAVVTWAVATLEADKENLRQSSCGTCSGWYPSVARGELQALAEALEHACIPAVYVGDCQYVVDGVLGGVPRSFASASSPHADLWRRVRWLLNDHGEGITVQKIKAHRSRARAELEDAGVGLELWQGNYFADVSAKALALRLWEGVRPQMEELEARSADFIATMARAGICTRIAQQALDALRLPRVSKRVAKVRAVAGQCGDHQLIPRTTGRGHWCLKCRLITRTPTSLRSLAARPCRGEVLLGVHRSHHLRWSMGVTWCETCGSYMSRLPRALRHPCAGAPRSIAARNVLRRLRSGLPPTTAAYLCRAAADDDWTVGLATLEEAREAVSTAAARPAENQGDRVDDNLDPSTGSGESGTIRASAWQQANAATPGAIERQPLRSHDSFAGGAAATAPTAASERRTSSVSRLILHRHEQGVAEHAQRCRSAPQHRARHPSRGPSPRHAPVASPRDGARRVRQEGEDPALDRDPQLQPRPRVHSRVGIDCGRISAHASSTVPVAPHAAPHAASCCLEDGVSWTRRLAPTVHALRRECGGCNILTASRCSACRSPLCFKCARGRIDCPKALAMQPRGEDRFDADAGDDVVAARTAHRSDGFPSAAVEVAATPFATRVLSQQAGSPSVLTCGSVGRSSSSAAGEEIAAPISAEDDTSRGVGSRCATAVRALSLDGGARIDVDDDPCHSRPASAPPGGGAVACFSAQASLTAGPISAVPVSVMSPADAVALPSTLTCSVAPAASAAVAVAVAGVFNRR